MGLEISPCSLLDVMMNIKPTEIIGNFLNMGFLVAERPGAVINEGLLSDQRWTNPQRFIHVSVSCTRQASAEAG
jgi:hypothetical protein